MPFVVIVLFVLGGFFLLTSLIVARWRLAAWTGLILLSVVPWYGWPNRSRWDRVLWVPFSGPEIVVRDLVVNLALYVPLGWLLVRHHVRGPRAIVAAIGLSFALSLATEWAQVYSARRFPSATDVCMNTLGGVLGAALGRREKKLAQAE